MATTPEKQIEALLTYGVKKMGGVAYKFVSPGNSGVPDRIVVMPGGRIYFVELKRTDGKLTSLQGRQINRLQRLGCETAILYGNVDVSNFLLRLSCEQWAGENLTKRGDAL